MAVPDRPNMVANWHRDNSRRKEIPLEDHLDLPFKGEQPEAALLRNQETEHLMTSHSRPSVGSATSGDFKIR